MWHMGQKNFPTILYTINGVEFCANMAGTSFYPQWTILTGKCTSMYAVRESTSFQFCKTLNVLRNLYSFPHGSFVGLLMISQTDFESNSQPHFYLVFSRFCRKHCDKEDTIVLPKKVPQVKS